MKARHIVFCATLAAAPVAAFAETPVSPKYPPGFDCASVPAGSERESCRQTQLDPAPDALPGSEAVDKPGAASGGAIQTPGDVSPPTIPNESGGGDDTGPLDN